MSCNLRRTSNPPGGRAIFLSTFLPALLLVTLSPAHAGSVRLLDGKLYEGDVKIENGALQVTPSAGTRKPVTVELTSVLWAVLRDQSRSRDTTMRSEDGRVPPPWESTDIGDLAQKSSIRYDNSGLISAKSCGAQLGGKADALCFVRQSVEGECDVVTRIKELRDPRRASAGLMIRAGSDPDAAHVALMLVGTEVKIVKRAKRGETSDGGTVSPRAPAPVWLKLSRRGAIVTAFVSRDGDDWQQVAQESITLENSAYYGLAVCGQPRNEFGGCHAEGLKVIPRASGAAIVPDTLLKEGLMLRSGTLLAGANLHHADGTSVKFSKDERRMVSLSTTAVARLILADLSPDMARKIPLGRRGVLLRSGDFIEGQFKGVRDGRLLLSSAVFGLASYERGQAIAVILNDIETARPAMIVRTTDGSTYHAASASIDKDRLMLEDSAGGAFALSAGQIEQISAGPGRLQPLDALKPAAVDGPNLAGQGLSVISGNGVKPTLGQQTIDRGLILTSGSSATWKLAKAYKVLTFRAGVPANVLPTQGARIIVLGDGKELYKSSPKSSRDQATSQSIVITGVELLTLKIEATAPNAMPIPVVWAETALVR